MTIDSARLRTLLLALEKATCKGVDKWAFLHPNAPAVRQIQVRITGNGTFIYFPNSFGLAQDIRNECSDKWPAVVKQTNALREAMPTTALPFTANFNIMAYHTEKGIVHKVEDRAYLPAIVSANSGTQGANAITHLVNTLSKLALIAPAKSPADITPWTVSKMPCSDLESPMVHNHPVFLGTVYARTQDEANLKAAAMLLCSKDFEALLEGHITQDAHTDIDRVAVSPTANNLVSAFSSKDESCLTS